MLRQVAGFLLSNIREAVKPIPVTAAPSSGTWRISKETPDPRRREGAGHHQVPGREDRSRHPRNTGASANHSRTGTSVAT